MSAIDIENGSSPGQTVPLADVIEVRGATTGALVPSSRLPDAGGEVLIVIGVGVSEIAGAGVPAGTEAFPIVTGKAVNISSLDAGAAGDGVATGESLNMASGQPQDVENCSAVTSV